MKRLTLVSLFTILISFFSFADGYLIEYNRRSADIMEVNFQLEGISIKVENINGQLFSIIDFESNTFTQEAGYARIPFVGSSVMIDRQRNVNMHVYPGEYEEIDLKAPLLPSRGVIYRDQDPASIPYVIDPNSMTDSWYPGNLSEVTDPFIVRDIRGVSAYIYPFQYNAAQQKLRIYNSLTVELIQNNTIPVNPLLYDEKPVNREMHGIYKSVFVNYPEDLSGRDDLTIGQYGDILVITTARDEAAIQPYIDWKRQKGYNVTKEVVATGTEVNQLVQDAYDANNNLLYVQMVGDWADIQCETLNFGAPMDPQVGCVVGNDEYADICIGRISANSPDDVTVQVNKIINYEKNPEVGGTWYSVATGIASNEGSGIGDDGESDWQHNDVIWNNKLDPFTFDGYNPIYDPGASSSMVSTAVNAGTSVINYTGHGSMTSWGTTGFSNSNIANLTNGDKLPFIVSVACNNGDFHQGTCFAESWVRKEDGGAVMMLAASISQPWAPPMRGQDYFMDILIGGYDYSSQPGQSGISTEEQRTTLGAIVFNGLTLMTTESGNYDDWETAKTWNTFGDPSMQVRTATPEAITLSSSVVLSGVPFTTTVNAGAGVFAGAMVALTQGDSTYKGITDEAGAVSIMHNLDPGDALLVVTGFNLETIYDTVIVIPPDGPYVIFDSLVINDINGNANGMLDYAEQAYLSVALKNVGADDAINVSALISTGDEFASLLDNTEEYGTIPAGGSVYIENAFEILASEDLNDLHTIIIELEAEAGGSDEVWMSSFTVTGHAAELMFEDFTINDSDGNGNGRIDPGETVQLHLTTMNTGSADAFQSSGILSSSSEYITIAIDSLYFGDIPAGETAELIFDVAADEGTPEGHSASFTFDMNAEYNLNANTEFFITVGQIPVLVINLDKNGLVPSAIETSLENLSVGSQFYDAFPENLELYTSVFVCLGTYPENTVLSEDEGQRLADYLNNGGNLYMEGGDTWYYDQLSTPTPVHPMFNVDGIADGSGDLAVIMGMEGGMCQDMTYEYSGDNSYIDHIEALPGAMNMFENSNPNYIVAVTYDAGEYKTVGAAFEFEGLDDNDYTKDDYMIEILNFFGIEGVWTGTNENFADRLDESLNIAPNPVTSGSIVSFGLENKSTVRADVYNLGGQRVTTLIDGNMEKGTHSINWGGNDDSGNQLPGGVYFVKLQTSRASVTRKVVVLR